MGKGGAGALGQHPRGKAGVEPSGLGQLGDPSELDMGLSAPSSGPAHTLSPPEIPRWPLVSPFLADRQADQPRRSAEPTLAPCVLEFIRISEQTK